MQTQSQPRPTPGLDHWVNSGEAPVDQPPSPPSPLSQGGQVGGYENSDHSHSNSGGGSSSGHHSHEPSLEHALSLPNPPPAPPSSLPPSSSGLSLAFQSSPRTFDFRNSGSQPSSLRTSFSSYGNSDEALDSLRRSYSTTSDIRGTLEETRLDADPRQAAEQWAMNNGSYVYPSSRRESEPLTFAASSRFYETSAGHQTHRSSLPYPLERADSLPIRRLRRHPQPGSPGWSSTAPSLTDGSTSPSTSRSSFVETPYLAEDVAGDPRYVHSHPPQQVGGYPFPDMYHGGPPPISRHSISGPSYQSSSGSSTPGHPFEMNRHGKRLSVSHDSIEGDRALSPRPHSSSFVGSVPSAAPYGSHFGLPDPPKSAYDFRPESARATSPRGGVYDIDEARQVFLPFFPHQQPQHHFDHQAQQQQHHRDHQLPAYPPSPSLDLLPPHDGYESIKKRRMSSIGGSSGGAPSPSLGSRREAASELHLSGLPLPASSLPFDTVHSHHSNSPSYQHYEHGSASSYPSSQPIPLPQHPQPRTPTSAPALVRNGSYTGVSFNSPAFLDNPPPNLLDSPIGSPYKHGHPIGGPPPVSPPIEPPGELPHPPPSAAPSSGSNGRRGSVVVESVEVGAGGGGGTAFMDPNYPIDNFTICHRRPPQADFEVPDRLLPRTQDLRFEEDQYTPLWVRQEGKDKEGRCALCPGNGKWLQLKNSAFWYHRQFQHGISSSSGHYFLPPLETRLDAETSKCQGLCHMCGEWKPYQNHKGSSNSAGKGPTPWFRHAHECHQYFSPKKEARKNMKLARSVN
ncbi:DUF4451 domain-containing protein [Sporobolomyces salmoneus]|uniref:DUF4451 domain-containing protein n=1 Tax=Sporobolomyces salmoneus TaxID=183962 RepID=UPI0031741B55